MVLFESTLSDANFCLHLTESSFVDRGDVKEIAERAGVDDPAKVIALHLRFRFCAVVERRFRLTDVLSGFEPFLSEMGVFA
jgi:hypothetical protein